jgi:diacylglycerol kinase family enzyme
MHDHRSGPTAETDDQPAAAGVLFANASAGPEVISSDELEELMTGPAMPEVHVEPCDPTDLSELAREAVRTNPAFVGVAGGDGSVRAVAEALTHTTVPLLVIPTGTRNHFAGDLGIESPAAAADALRAAHVRAVDAGSVNGRVFVNNTGIGQYPAMVRRRDEHQRRLPKWTRTVMAIAGQVRHGRKFDVSINGVTHRVWAVFVGNGRYGSTLGDLAQRESLTDGVLDVRVVDATGRLARLRVIAALVAGRLDRSPLVQTFATPSVHIHLRRPVTDVALDGEVVRLVPPLEVTCHARALRVLAPDPDG